MKSLRGPNKKTDMLKVKRGHKTLTIKEKGEILKCLEKGELGKNLAKNYGIGTSTISEIKKNKDRIMSFILSNDCRNNNQMRRTLKSGDFPKLEQNLYSWYMEEKLKNYKITTDMFIEKAKEINQKLDGGEKFKASKGWIENFKKRFNIRISKLTGAHDDTLTESIKEGNISDVQSNENTSVISVKAESSSYKEDVSQSEDNIEYEMEPLEEEIVPPKVSHQKAVECFSQCLEWAYDNRIELTDLLFLGKIRDKAIKLNENEENGKQ